MKDLQAQISEYAACFDHSPIPCGIVEMEKDQSSRLTDLVLRYSNAALVSLTNDSSNLPISKSIREIFPSEYQNWLSFCGELVSGGGGKRKTVYITGMDRFLSIYAFCPTEEISVFLVIDVTDDKKAEQEYIAQLHKQKRLLEQRYRRTLAIQDKTGRESIGSLHMNLSQNLCGEWRSADERIRKLQKIKSVDSLFDHWYGHCVDPEHRDEFKAIFSRADLLHQFINGHVYVCLEHRLQADESRSEWVRTSAYMAQNPDTGDVEALIWSSSIHEEKTIRDIFNRFGEIEYDYIAVIDIKTQNVSIVKKRESVEGLPEVPSDYSTTIQELVPRYAIKGQEEEMMTQVKLTHVISELEKRDTHTFSFPIRKPDGRNTRKKWQYTYLDKSRRTIALTCSDITDLYNADVHPVTNIYNRVLFAQKARRMLDDMPDEKFMLIRCDIDRFKVYNDIYGSAEGDRLLMAIASTLRKIPAHPFIFGHIEADHFVCLAPAILIDKIPGNDEMSRYMRTIQPDFDFSIRIGIYIVADPALDINIMLDRALLALRSCKGKFAEHIAVYKESMRDSLLLEQEFLSDMRAALKNGEFGIYLQPQINYVKNELVGAEAVVRWFHPTKGILQPSAFIHVFEKSGGIAQLDLYVCEACCRLLRKWMEAGLHPVPLSVNISRVDLYNPRLCEKLVGIMEKYDLSRSLLRLEITESAYMDNPKQLIGVVEQLRKKGFLIEMDDFGSGYSSLNSLKDMPVDVIKLDLNFLTSSGDTGKSGIILNSVVRMAHWLNVQIIAEGVETKNQADYLKTIGCELIQGFLYAAPMPAEEFAALLADSKIGDFGDSGIGSDFLTRREFWSPDVYATIVFNKFIGPGGIIEYRNGIVEATQFNDKFFETTGISRSLFQKRSGDLLTAVFPDDRSDVVSVLESAQNTEEELEVDSRWLQTSGEMLWLKIHIRQIAKSANRCVFYVSIENETEYKHILQRKSELESQLQALKHSLPRRFLRLEMSNALRISLVGELTAAAFDFTGSEYQELYGDDFLKAVHPEDRDHIATELAALKAEPDRIVDVTFRHICRDNGYRLERLSGVSFQSESSVSGINAVLIDIVGQGQTERKTS